MTRLTAAAWRRLVQKEIGKVPDIVWEEIIKSNDDYLDVANQEAEEGGTGAGVGYLLERVGIELDKFHRYHGTGPRLPKLQSTPVKESAVKPLLPGAHCAALTKIFSGMVNRDADVRQFRSDILGGKLLSGSEAADWFQSQAKKEPPPAGGCSCAVRCPILITIPLTIYANHVNKKGVLARLQEVSQKISGYGFWTEGQASYFILTGIGHPIAPAKVKIRLGAPPFNRIVLEVLPHVPGSMVERLYRGARTSLAKELGEKEKHRQLTEKHLALAAFAAETPPPWSMRLRRWNEAHPKEAYPATTSGKATFARDCRTAYERLTGGKLTE